MKSSLSLLELIHPLGYGNSFIKGRINKDGIVNRVELNYKDTAIGGCYGRENKSDIEICPWQISTNLYQNSGNRYTYQRFSYQ